MKRRHWTEAELAVLREFYPNERGQDVAARLGRVVSSVHRKANELGITKSEAFKASDLAGRIQRGKQSPAMIATRIKPGSVPWNKGVKGSTGTQEGCRATQFKKGRKAEESANYVPIGSLRVSKDGYLERKVTDDPTIYPARRWVPVARLVWEAAHGPIPAGHIVIYRPGMKTVIEAEITVDRLECISKGENARRNHPRTKSPELAQLVQLKGAITRQVNRIAREAEERNARMSAPHITELRQQLLDTLKDLRNKEQPMEPDRARAVAQVASVLVDTAKVEVDYIKATGSDRSDFIEPPTTQLGNEAGPANGITSITRHRLAG